MVGKYALQTAYLDLRCWNSYSYSQFNCPCTNTITASQATPPPDFVNNDYFCDTGASGTFSADPLWDGAGCGPLNTSCSFNSLPWFYKQLSQPTIEMRVRRKRQ